MDRFDTLQHGTELAAPADADASLIVFVLDTNPAAWASLPASRTLRQTLADLLIFINAHLALSHLNQAAVIASHDTTAKFLYPSIATPLKRDAKREANGYRPFLELQDTVLHTLSQLYSEEPQQNKDDTQQRQQTTMMSGAISMALSYINRATLSHPGMCGRIVIASVTGDLAAQYIPMMNCIFAAQRQKITIDVVKFGGDAVFLQQASDATHGTYRNVKEGESLLAYYMILALPDRAVRSDLVMPASANVDFRAACFCHKRVLDIGYVCSVCLSIFCQPLQVCITCDSPFDAQELERYQAKPAVLIPQKQKKRKKQQVQDSIMID